MCQDIERGSKRKKESGFGAYIFGIDLGLAKDKIKIFHVINLERFFYALEILKK